MAVDKFTDSVLGEVILRRHAWSSGVSFKMSVRGEIIASAGKATPLVFIKQAVRSKRREIAALKQHYSSPRYDVNQPIGKSHRLEISLAPSLIDPKVQTHQRVIQVWLNQADDINQPQLQSLIQDEVIKAHRKEAKAYLPRRLKLLAERHGYSYQRNRFTHASTRWGSCSSSGTISMNIALMKLPLDLIDYVLIHELCHTKQMNHSDKFWTLVASHDPAYKLHRRQIKTFSPSL